MPRKVVVGFTVRVCVREEDLDVTAEGGVHTPPRSGSMGSSRRQISACSQGAGGGKVYTPHRSPSFTGVGEGVGVLALSLLVIVVFVVIVVVVGGGRQLARAVSVSVYEAQPLRQAV